MLEASTATPSGAIQQDCEPQQQHWAGQRQDSGGHDPVDDATAYVQLSCRQVLVAAASSAGACPPVHLAIAYVDTPAAVFPLTGWSC